MTNSLSAHSSRGFWGTTLRDIVLTLCVVSVAKTVAAEPYYVPSGSMEPTLLIGDELIAAKYAYGYSRYSAPLGLGPAADRRLFEKMPARGDVVVFRLPRDPSVTYVKRVIGLPGDRLQMQDGRLWINGAEVDQTPDGTDDSETSGGRHFTAHRYIETLPGGRAHPILKLTSLGPLDDTPVYEVPPGHLFMMGDNRDNSEDSRIPPEAGGVGYVPVENLVGRVDAILGSWDLGMTAQPIWTWARGLRLERFFSKVG